MTTDSETWEGFQPDDRLAGIYELAMSHDEDVLETVCPSFVSMKEEGRYREEELLGQGGLKSVFRSYDIRTRRWVAMARLRPDRGLQFYDLFVREAWLISSLSHPNIINVYDAGVDENGSPFFTMDLKENLSLAQRISGDQAWNQSELLEVFQKICDAVAYAHSQGILHLDLKPENIQCNRFGEVLVCDWGLGKRDREEDEAFSEEIGKLKSVENVTLLGKMKGSPGYMAPEQVDPNGVTDCRTDVYALGCILHHILCGEVPFQGSVNDVLNATVNKQVPGLRASYPDRNVPEGLEAVVLKATATAPASRYISVENLRLEIHKYLEGYSTKAEQSGFFREAKLFFVRNRIPAGITVIALVLLTVISVLFVQRLGRQQLATEEERDRVNLLMEEVELLSSDYRELSESSDVSKKELANRLARSANGLRNIGFFELPVLTLHQTDRMLDMAISLDPDCMPAHQLRFSSHMVRMNFNRALKLPIPTTDENRAFQKQLARKFSTFAFDDKKRPSEKQLVSVFRHARENKLWIGSVIERMFAYQVDTVGDLSKLTEGMQALLEYYNHGEGHLRLTVDHQNATAEIWTDRSLIKLRNKSKRNRRCLLLFFPLKEVRIVTEYAFDLKELDELPIETLDLSRCGEIEISETVSLPELRRIKCRKGQFKKEGNPLMILAKHQVQFEEIER